MRRVVRHTALVLAGLAFAVRPESQASAAGHSSRVLEVNVGERLLVVAPHPDDETLGAGGLIEHVLAPRGTVLVVFVTGGDGYVEALVHETGQLRPGPADYIACGDRRLRATCW